MYSLGVCTKKGMWQCKNGHTGARTQDLGVISTTLCRLSYTTCEDVLQTQNIATRIDRAAIEGQNHARSGDRTHDLRIMRPTRLPTALFGQFDECNRAI